MVLVMVVVFMMTPVVTFHSQILDKLDIVVVLIISATTFVALLFLLLIMFCLPILLHLLQLFLLLLFQLNLSGKLSFLLRNLLMLLMRIVWVSEVCIVVGFVLPVMVLILVHLMELLL